MQKQTAERVIPQSFGVQSQIVKYVPLANLGKTIKKATIYSKDKSENTAEIGYVRRWIVSLFKQVQAIPEETVQSRLDCTIWEF